MMTLQKMMTKYLINGNIILNAYSEGHFKLHLLNL